MTTITPDMIDEAARLEAAWPADAGTYYQNRFEADALPHWCAMHPVLNHCLTAGDGREWVPLPDGFEARALILARLTDALKLLGRGAWAMARRTWHVDTYDGRRNGVSWDLLIHDGRGYVYKAQTSHITDRDPGFSDALAHLVGQEVYQARRFARECAERARAVSIAAERGYKAGQRLKLQRISWQRFSSAVIESVSETGVVVLTACKRGSGRRWRVQCDAHAIVEAKA